MEKLKKTWKGIPVWVIALALVALVGTAIAGYIVWTRVTVITVQEPFEITSNLPETATLFPNTYSYTINVTNHGSENLNAILYYTYTAEHCTINITPNNGTSYTVDGGQTTTIPISITVGIDGYPANGTATINWWIERSPS